MNAYPFSVFKRADRPCFLVAFKDDNGKYLPPRSTKKTCEKEAMKVAFEWFRNGIPQKKNTLWLADLSMKALARNISSSDEAAKLAAEMKRLGLVKNVILNDTPEAENFVSFLKRFWDWDTSPYINEKLRKSHGIHRAHCSRQAQAVVRYWEPFFSGRILGEINSADIDAFITHIGEMELSASRKNVIIMAGTKPLRWAFSKSKIERDPTRGHLLFSGEKVKRKILTPTAATAVFRVEWSDERAKLGNMLAAVTGMRIGKILALQVQDLGSDCLYVHSSWNRIDKLKLPKNNEKRTVEIPFPDLMNSLIEQAKQNPWGVSPDSFVFWTETNKDAPMHDSHFRKGLREALVSIGFSAEEAATFAFHSWRHFFTSYMINKLDKKLLKSQTGHKTDVMLAHYANHETAGDRELIQAAKLETFSGLLPVKPKMLVFKKEVCVEAACV